MAIVFKNTQFYRYGGSQDYVLKQIKDEPNKHLIHIQNAKHGRMWGAIPHDDILKSKWIDKNNGLFEVITEKYPCKVYFDIDSDPGDEISLDKVVSIIKQYFGENTKMAISGYTEPYHSYHICLYEYGINSKEDLEELKALVIYINENQYKFFDWKVYTKNRNMKVINQSKPKKSIQRIIQDDNPKHHLITFFIDTIKYNLPKFSVIQPKVESIKKAINSTKMDYSTLPKLKLELKDDINLSDPKEILSIIPLDGSGAYPHNYTWRVGLFCVKNGLTCNDFIEWYKNKSEDEDKIDKWKYIHWGNLIEFSKTYPVSKKAMLKMLQFFYPNILLDKELRIFASKFIIKDNIRWTDYLTLDDFNTDKKGIVINIQMGGGKTHNTIQYIKQHGNFCWITPNIALAENTHYRIEQENINCVNYRKGSSIDERKYKIAKAYNLIVCLNSLKYVEQNYDILVIDEIETFLKLWFNNSTIKCLDECWNIFITLIKNCKKLILLDAFLSQMTIDFLKSLNIEYTIIKKTNESNERKIIKYQNFNQIFNKIINNIKQGKKSIIFYPYKNAQHQKKLPSMHELVNVIENETNKKGIYHNADACDSNNRMLDNVNKNWVNYDFVISNNKINVGLNFDVDYFDEVYLMVAGFNSPRDIVQFSYRARTLKNNLINYCLLDKQNPYMDVEIQKVDNFNEVYKALFENVLIERRSPVADTMDFFFSKAKYEIIGNCQEIIKSDKLDFELIDYYDYDSLEPLDDDGVKEIIIKSCCMESNVVEKLSLRRYFYDMKFSYNTPNNVKSDIWNNNKINFMDNCLNVLYRNDVIKKLKENYGWELYLPEEIKGKFKFNKEDLDAIFDNVNFKYLKKDKSTHGLILRNYLDTIYGVHLYKRKGENAKNVYKVNDTLKDVYISVVEHHNKSLYDNKINGNGCLIDVNESYDSCL